MSNLDINGKDKVFGFYDDVELAGLVAEEARSKFHGKFLDLRSQGRFHGRLNML